MNKISSNVQGVGFLVLGMLIFSLQDIAVKWIGGDYPVLEIVIFRSLIALPLTLLFFRYEGGQGLPTTQQPKLEHIRGLFYFLSYTTHFMGLAALPLAEIAAIKFSAPLMITCLSVVILGELTGWATSLAGAARWFYGCSADCQTRFGHFQYGVHFYFDIRALLCACRYAHAQTANNR
jgi:drug/metabolite transporter (DMT)-like permease